jgi:hypothetical protein
MTLDRKNLGNLERFICLVCDRYWPRLSAWLNHMRLEHVGRGHVTAQASLQCFCCHWTPPRYPSPRYPSPRYPFTPGGTGTILSARYPFTQVSLHPGIPSPRYPVTQVSLHPWRYRYGIPSARYPLTQVSRHPGIPSPRYPITKVFLV